MQVMKEWQHNQMTTHQIVRFVGATSKSQDMICLLQYLTLHLARLFTIPIPDVTSHADVDVLIDFFRRTLSQVPKNHKLIIFVDGLDELSDASEVLHRQWLPVTLSANVKVILTVAMDTKINKQLDEACHVLQLGPFDQLTSDELLRKWLKNANRKLTSEQWKRVRRHLGKRHHSPLFLKLVFEQLKTWRSFDADVTVHGSDAETCLMKTVESLESKHGRCFVTHALLFIEFTKHGIGTSELEDVLSLDEKVRVQYVFARFAVLIRML